MKGPRNIQPLKRALINAGWIVLGSSLQRLMPFFTFPVLSRRLGHEAFGQYIAAIALSAIVTQIVEFGFNISATSKVAESDSSSKTKMSEILSEVIAGRLFISLVLIATLFAVRQFHDIFIADNWLFWSSVGLGVVIGSDFRFMFYGRQSVRYLTFYALTYTVLSTLVILIAVRQPNSLWLAFFVPAKTPQDIIAKLNGEINRILKNKDTNEFLLNTGVEVAPGTPEELAKFVRSDMEKYGRVIKAANIRAD